MDEQAAEALYVIVDQVKDRWADFLVVLQTTIDALDRAGGAVVTFNEEDLELYAAGGVTREIDEMVSAMLAVGDLGARLDAAARSLDADLQRAATAADQLEAAGFEPPW